MTTEFFTRDSWGHDLVFEKCKYCLVERPVQLWNVTRRYLEKPVQSAQTALFVGIFKYRKHIRVERFCKEHAAVASYGELPSPIIPEIKSIDRESIKI
jgi:hypothetical protein